MEYEYFIGSNRGANSHRAELQRPMDASLVEMIASWSPLPLPPDALDDSRPLRLGTDSGPLDMFCPGLGPAASSAHSGGNSSKIKATQRPLAQQTSWTAARWQLTEQFQQRLAPGEGHLARSISTAAPGRGPGAAGIAASVAAEAKRHCKS